MNGLLLSQEVGHVDNLITAFSNGKFIITLTQLIIGEKITGVKNDPTYLKQKIENTRKCFEILATKGIEMQGVSPEDLVSGKRVAIKTFCKTLQKEGKNGSISTSKSLDLTEVKMPIGQPGDPSPYMKLQQRVAMSNSLNAITSESGEIGLSGENDLSLEEIQIETKSDSIQTVRKESREEKSENEKDRQEGVSSRPKNLEIQIESEVGKAVKRRSLELPPHRSSNKFLPSTPQKPVVTTNSEEILKDTKPSHNTKQLEDVKNKMSEQKAESKRDEEETKLLRSKMKTSKEETGGRHLQSKQKRYSPLDITKLAGKLFDAFNNFSPIEENLSEQPMEESLTGESELPLTETIEASDVITSEPIPPVDALPDSAVKESLTVLPPLSLEDLTPEVGETAVEKNAKRILRKNKRQATVIESREVLQARVQKEEVTQEDESSHLDSSTPEELPTHSAQDSISSVVGSEGLDKAPEALKHQKREKTGLKVNHRIRSLSPQYNESGMTAAHSVEDVWQELQRMKATVRTHHSLANRFAQDYPVMRRCFETQSQSVRKLERIQHTRGRNSEKELQDKLALMEGYLVQTMRENADLRSKVWGLTTRLTQLEKSGASSRPSSILSFSDVHRREQMSIQDISMHKRALKLKKFFGEEPPPLLEEIPTSFTHDASKEDDEIV